MKYILYTVAIILLGFIIFQYVHADGSGSLIALIGAALCMIFANFDAIQSFSLSGTGVSAQTRQVVQEARDTIEQTKLLAAQLARFAILMLNAEGRIGGMALDKKKELSEQILQTLRDLHVSQQQIDQIVDIEYPYACFDYPYYITNRLISKLAPAKKEEWTAFFSADRRKGIGYQPTPTELHDFLESVELLTPELNELIEDYRYYRQNHRHRRPEIWATRAHWNE